jgi:type VI secretion system secreted protein VgrG
VDLLIMVITLHVPSQKLAFSCHKMSGHERLGEAVDLELEVTSAKPIDPAKLLGASVVVGIDHAATRAVPGVIERIAAIASVNPDTARLYRMRVRSPFALLGLRERTRIYQHSSIPAVVAARLKDVYSGVTLRQSLAEEHAERDYVTQYFESDAGFVRRLCEEEGLFFYFENGDKGECLVLCDDSTSLDPSFDEPLALYDDMSGAVTGPFAERLEERAVLRPGKVTLRDYNPDHPQLELEAEATRGNDVEGGLEMYEAPGRFADADEGQTRADRRLQSLGVDAKTYRFFSNDPRLSPGSVVELSPAGDYPGVEPGEPLFVIAVHHDFAVDAPRNFIEVEAIPQSVPYRLPRVTPRPRAAGVQPAQVTCDRNEEISPDEQGRVFLHFHWDREGPRDTTSSLPVRCTQANTPGSMAVPRRDWEVVVAFEECDPDRPYVLGRTFNAKFVPPEPLPDNKTVSCWRSYSSPGGGASNSIQFDDAGGRQHMTFEAGFGRSANVANNAFAQTANNETAKIGASQSRAVGADESLSLSQTYLTSAASQGATVGATQKVDVIGSAGVAVGSESVMVGGALMEQIGNPAAGAANLAKAAVLDGIGSMGKAGAAFVAGYHAAEAGIKGYQAGGWQGALKGVGGAAAGQVAGMVPGGGALFASINSCSSAVPWLPARLGGAGEAAGGGTAGASAGSGAEGGGAGHRVTMVGGAMSELIGGMYGVATPGKIGWNTTGASTHLVGGSHLSKSARYTTETLGNYSETLGSLSINAKVRLGRKITGALNTTIGGALTSKATGKHSITAGGALTMSCTALTLDGATVVFQCGGTKVTATSSSVTVESDSITITGSSKQSGLTAHR